MAGPNLSPVHASIVLSLFLLPVLSVEYVNSDLSAILSRTPSLIRRVYDPKALYPHPQYFPERRVPFHGHSKISHGEVVGKFHGGVFKGQYWSKKFSGTLRKNYDGRELNSQYEGNKNWYQGQVTGRLNGRGWFKGLYKTYRKITYYRGSLQPRAAKPRRYKVISRVPNARPVQRLYSPYTAYAGYPVGLNKRPRYRFRFYKKIPNPRLYKSAAFKSNSARSRKFPYPINVPRRDNTTRKTPQITLVAKKHRLGKPFKRNHKRKGTAPPNLKVSQVQIRKLKPKKDKKEYRRRNKGVSSKIRREFIRRFAKKLEATRTLYRANKEAQQKKVMKIVM